MKLQQMRILQGKACNSFFLCSLFQNHIKDMAQLFLQCPFTLQLSNWKEGIIYMRLDMTCTNNIFNIVEISWCTLVNHLLLALSICIIWKICHLRNTIRFKPGTSVINYIKKLLVIYSSSFKGYMYSSMFEFTIIEAFEIKCKHPPTPDFFQIN